MKYVKLGKTGLDVSRIAFGTGRASWGRSVDLSLAGKLLRSAYDHGINTFDTAENYGGAGQAETMLGTLLKKQKWPRHSYVVASKVFSFNYAIAGKLFAFDSGPNTRGLSRKKIRDGCDGSLKRLGLDYIDLYYCHSFDPNTPVEETVFAMHQLVQQGKILYWGTSNWSCQQILTALEICKHNNLTLPSMEQRVYNFFTRHEIEGEFEKFAQEQGLGIFTCMPLDEGILTGKYNQGIPPDSRLANDAFSEVKEQFESEAIHAQKLATLKELQQIANEADVTLAQLVIAWCFQRSVVNSVVIGASKVEQIASNLQVMEKLDGLNDSFWSKVHQIKSA